MKKAFMKTIMAGPKGNKFPGDSVKVSGDKDPLIAGGFATYETAMAASADEFRATASGDDITSALDLLDTGNDEHWTAKGLPALSAMRELTGDVKLSRHDINAATPDFERQ